MTSAFNVLAIGRICQFIGNLLLIRLATNLLGMSEFGKLALINAAVGLLSLALINPLGMYFQRHLIEFQTAKLLRAYVNFFLVVCFSLALFSSLAFWGLGSAFSVTAALQSGAVAFLIGFSFFSQSIWQSLASFLNLFELRHAYVLVVNAGLFLGIVLASVAGLALSWTGESWLLGISLAQLVIAIWALVIFRRDVPSAAIGSSFQRLPLRSVAHFAGPLWVSVIFFWMQNQGYRFWLEKQYSLEAVGIFAAGYAIASGVFSAVESLLSSFVLPYFYRTADSSNESERISGWSKYVHALLPVYCMTLVFLICFSDSICFLFLGKYGGDAMIFAHWGAAIEFFRVTINALTMAHHSRKKTSNLIWIQAMGAMSVCGLLYITRDSGVVAVILSLACAASIQFGIAILIGPESWYKTLVKNFQLRHYWGLLLPWWAFFINPPGNFGYWLFLALAGLSGGYWFRWYYKKALSSF